MLAFESVEETCLALDCRRGVDERNTGALLLAKKMG